MSIEELKRLAEAATPGPWVKRPYIGGIGCGVDGLYQVCHHALDSDADYIAAADPTAVLLLIRQLEQHKADLEVNIRLLAEARKNDVHCMAWLADCRIAVDDNGKRMLPEFVEYLKALKQQSDELLAAAEEVINNQEALPAYLVAMAIHAVGRAKA